MSGLKYADLRDFIAQLEQRGELRRIRVPVDTHLEMTEISDRVLRAGANPIHTTDAPSRCA